MRVLAVDVGGTHVACGAVDDAVLLSRTSISTNSSGLLAGLLPRLADHFREMISEHGGGFTGIGFGFCGLVDGRAGRIVSTNHKYADATSIDLVSWANSNLAIPLILENDARMALLGELHCGAARGSRDVVMMTLGTGIGTAVMIEGHLMRGKHYQAGCLGGHFTVMLEGRVCSCGSRGCFEAEASTYALPGICESWPGFEASSLRSVPKLDFQTLFACADAGDNLASQVRKHCVRIWSACALSLVHAYDPELLVVGGGIARGSYPLLPAIQKHIDGNAWTPWGRVSVVPAALGSDAALLGAASLFQLPR